MTSYFIETPLKALTVWRGNNVNMVGFTIQRNWIELTPSSNEAIEAYSRIKFRTIRMLRRREMRMNSELPNGRKYVEMISNFLCEQMIQDSALLTWNY